MESWSLHQTRLVQVNVLFEIPDISRLLSPKSCINDVCINECILLLFSKLDVPATHDFAVFSTHHLTHTRYHASNHVLWKAMAYIHEILDEGHLDYPYSSPFVSLLGPLYCPFVSSGTPTFRQSRRTKAVAKWYPHTYLHVCLSNVLFTWSFSGCHGIHHSVDVDRETDIPGGPDW